MTDSEADAIADVKRELAAHTVHDDAQFARLFEQQTVQHEANVKRFDDVQRGIMDLKISNLSVVGELQILKTQATGWVKTLDLLTLQMVGVDGRSGVSADVKELMADLQNRRADRRLAKAAIVGGIGGAVALLFDLWKWLKP